MTDWRTDPMPEIDEDTVVVEKKAAQERVQAAETGVERTREAVSLFASFVTLAKDLHEQNDYRNRMLAFMRGSNRATP